MLLGRLRTYPVTILVSLVAVVAWATPSLSLWLELDYGLVASGQWWRIWTGHLTHYDGNHLFWDLLMFAVLGAACERQHPRLFAPAVAVIVAGISLAIGLCCEQVSVYRGLSGVDTGLFVWLVADQVRQCLADRDVLAAVSWLLAVAGLIGKLVFEAATGQTLFVDSSTFDPLVESHLAGAAIGFLCSGIARGDPISESLSRPHVGPVRSNAARD